MTDLERKEQIESFLGKTVTVKIDRPIGYVHQKKGYTLTYPVNYGYIPGVIGGDGEELDVYLLCVDEPVEEYYARIIGAVYRKDDNEDKLIAAPDGTVLSIEEVESMMHCSFMLHASSTILGGWTLFRSIRDFVQKSWKTIRS